jgi:hypothetical protein
MAQMRKSAAKPPKLGTKVKVSSNVTVLAPKNKRISSAEEARLKNINKLAKSSKGDAKKSAKALKESGKTSKKAKVTTYTDRSVTPVRKGVQAREMAQKLSEKRTAERKRAGIPGGGGLRGGFGMGGGGGSGRSNVNR